MPTEVDYFPIVMDPRTGSPRRTKSSGEPYTEDDPEYWKLEKDGGIRQYRHLEYPAMRYRGVRGENGQPTTEHLLVRNEREDEAKRGEGWHPNPTLALAAFERGQEDIARAAAEAAYGAERMPERAKREYKRRSAESPKHVTDIQG